MGSKSNKFANVLSASAPSLSDSGSKTLVLQNIIEGDKPEYQYIKIDTIELNPYNDYNASDSEDDIRELAEDIRRNGLLHNVVVSYTNEGTYRLLSGERRLRAFRLLFEETHEAKYASIYSLVRKGLSEVEEMIILDAANIHTRSNGGDEKRYRKATARFVANLKAKFNISDEEAIRITKQHAGVQGVVIDKNITLETDLHPSLLSLLDDGSISKNQAYEYARLPQNVQEVIAEGLYAAKEKGVADFKKLNSDILEPAKNIRTLDESLDSQKKELEAIKQVKKETKAELAQAGDEKTEELQKKMEDLKQQEKQYKESIKNTQQALNENLEELNNQVSEAQANNEETIPSYIAGAAAVAEITALIDNVKQSVDNLDAVGLEEKAGYIAEADRETLQKSLSKLARKISRFARLFK